MNLSDLTPDGWPEIYKAISIGGIVGNVLANCEFVEGVGNTLYFLLDQNQSAVFNDELVPKLEQALADFFKTEIIVQISSGVVATETPAMLGQRHRREQHMEMVSEFEQDENVQQLIRHFSGTIAKDTIAPVTDRRKE